MTRPIRQKKSDRLLHPGASTDDIRCDYAVAPFDQAAREMDRRWGISRLPELVPPDVAAKFGSAIAHMNACIEAGDAEKCAAAAANCIRGLAAMDAMAEAAGKPKADPAILEYDLDGFRFGILPDDSHWQAAQDARPDLRLYSLREVAIALRGVSLPAVDAVKAAFPGATVTALRPKGTVNYDLGGDEIPW